MTGQSGCGYRLGESRILRAEFAGKGVAAYNGAFV
jgi:hypothetical protein